MKIRLIGDVNGDNKTTSSDLLKVMIAITWVQLGYYTMEQDMAQEPFADVNCDATITSSDLLQLKIIITKLMLGIPLR